MTDKEVMQHALDALDKIHGQPADFVVEVIELLREAIAKPIQSFSTSYCVVCESHVSNPCNSNDCPIPDELSTIAHPVPPTGKWQAIETAPKETLVLVYTPPQPEDWPNTVRINFDYICPEYEDWHDHCESFEHYMVVGGSNACGPDEVCTGPSEKAPYTHWMPLPAAPKETK